MTRLLILAGLLLSLFYAGQASAATFIGCFGANADPAYVAAFDTAGGLSKNNQVDYEQPRFYDEQQTWATPRLETPGHHSEHVHVGMCIPNAQTISKPMRMDVLYTFHNMQDYKIASAGMSSVTKNGSSNLWSASPSQVAQLQAAANASCPTCANNVQKVALSVTTTAPTTNGLKEIRGAIATVKNGPDAVFLQWNTDARWYLTDAWAGLPAAEPLGNQRAVRVRPIINFPKAGDPSTIQTDYHHSGFGCDPGTSSTKPSYLWTRTDVAKVWPDGVAHKVCLRVTDGGGPATLMVDPDFHHHYDAPTAACPNIDDHGNCLGRWYWQPDNTRKELFGLVNQDVIIPGSVVSSLAPGIHKLVFKSDDFAECVRNHNFNDWNLCPPDVRGTWSNVSVVPFKVN